MLSDVHIHVNTYPLSQLVGSRLNICTGDWILLSTDVFYRQISMAQMQLELVTLVTIHVKNRHAALPSAHLGLQVRKLHGSVFHHLDKKQEHRCTGNNRK